VSSGRRAGKVFSVAVDTEAVDTVAGNGRLAASGLEPPAAPTSSGRGPSLAPLIVVGAAFVLGVVLAKVVSWRSHAHPRG